MSSFVNRDINTPYVLKAEHVKSIWDVVRDKIGAPTIELECKDHISRSYTSLNKFKKFENTPQKEIQKLMIRAKSDDYSKHVRVQFSGSRWRTVNIEINGSETIVTNIQDALMDILEDTRPWYSLFSKIDVSNISFIICSFLFMVSYIKKADSAGITSSTKLTTTEAILATAVLGLTVVALIYITSVSSKAWKYCFPVSFFAISQGLNRYSFQEKFRWTVIIGFVVSLCASITIFFLQ